MSSVEASESCAPPTPQADDLRPVDGPGTDEELAAFAKALGHPLRVQVVRMLLRKDSCICGEIVTELKVPQSTVSQHLKSLKEAGLIRGTIDGPRVCYCIDRRGMRRLRALVGAL